MKMINPSSLATNKQDQKLQKHGWLSLFAALTASAVLGTLSAAAVGYAPPTGGLVGWWRGEGNANDSAGSHNGSLYLSPTFVTGVDGQAFHFANTFNRVLVPDSPDFKLTSSLTISCWAKVEANSHFLFFRGDNRPGLDPYYLKVSGQDTIQFGVMSLTQNASLQTGLPFNTWKHISAVLDGGAGELRIYVDGNLSASSATSVLPFADLDPLSQPGIGIGNHAGTGQQWPYIGSLDEVTLHSRALSATEIKDMYFSVVPEPSSMAVLALGMGLFIVARRRS